MVGVSRVVTGEVLVRWELCESAAIASSPARTIWSGTRPNGLREFLGPSSHVHSNRFELILWVMRGDAGAALLSHATDPCFSAVAQGQKRQ